MADRPNLDPVADILDQCLTMLQEGAEDPSACLERFPDHRTELAPLLVLATRLQVAGVTAPRREFREESPRRLRNLLETTPQQQRSPARQQTPDSPGKHNQAFAWLSVVRRRLERQSTEPRGRGMLRRGLIPVPLLASLVVAIVLLLSVGVASVSALALPGDALYPMKMAVESLRLLAADDLKAADLRLQFAAKRLQEVDAVLTQGRLEDATGALQGYVGHMDALVKLLHENQDLPGDGWQEFATEATARLDSYEQQLSILQSRVPSTASGQIESALAGSQAVDMAARHILRPRPGDQPVLPASATATATQTFAPRPTGTPWPAPAETTATPTATPTPTATATATATRQPTSKPTQRPAVTRPARPTDQPQWPTLRPTEWPTGHPSAVPTSRPTRIPTLIPTVGPTVLPTRTRPARPTLRPTRVPTTVPTDRPTSFPTAWPTEFPTAWPTEFPTAWPTAAPTGWPPTPPGPHATPPRPRSTPS